LVWFGLVWSLLLLLLSLSLLSAFYLGWSFVVTLRVGCCFVLLASRKNPWAAHQPIRNQCFKNICLTAQRVALLLFKSCPAGGREAGRAGEKKKHVFLRNQFEVY